jgi:hypothetical protein
MKSSVAAMAIVVLISGCQKNSYESCIDFQSAAAKREYLARPGMFKSEQSAIDSYVSIYCASVK